MWFSSKNSERKERNFRHLQSAEQQFWGFWILARAYTSVTTWSTWQQAANETSVLDLIVRIKPRTWASEERIGCSTCYLRSASHSSGSNFGSWTITQFLDRNARIARRQTIEIAYNVTARLNRVTMYLSRIIRWSLNFVVLVAGFKLGRLTISCPLVLKSSWLLDLFHVAQVTSAWALGYNHYDLAELLHRFALI